MATEDPGTSPADIQLQMVKERALKFLEENKSAVVLYTVAMAGWRMYYLAKEHMEKIALATFADDPEVSTAVMSLMVASAKDAASKNVLTIDAGQLLELIEKTCIPAIRILATERVVENAENSGAGDGVGADGESTDDAGVHDSSSGCVDDEE